MGIDLGQTVGILANIGVIAGIAFLALELRQNNSHLATQARYSLRQYRLDTAKTLMAPHMLDATHKYGSGAGVTPSERSAARMGALVCIELWEWQHGEYVAGMLKRSELPIDSWRLWFQGKSEIPIPISEVWNSRRNVMNPEFVRFFEENVLSS